MLDRILTSVSSLYSLDTVTWVFLSCFDKNNFLLWSHGSLQTQKPLKDVLPILYGSLNTESISYVAIDIVEDIKEHKDKESFLKLNMLSRGLFVLSWAKSWVMLPATLGVNSSVEALSFIKQKYNISGRVRLFSFATKRIIV